MRGTVVAPHVLWVPAQCGVPREPAMNKWGVVAERGQWALRAHVARRHGRN